MQSDRTLVLIPALNEAGSIRGVIEETRTVLPEAEFLVIDDGSTDATAALAVASGARVAVLPFNLGVGGALRVGFRYARDNGYGVVVQLDADGQHDPATVPAMLAALGESNLVIGARFAAGNDYEARGPRRWMMALMAKSLSRITGSRLTDVTSGFKACDEKVIALLARELPAEYLGDTVECLVLVAKAGFRVTQVPTRMRPRVAGAPSHTPIRAAVQLGRAMTALVLSLSRRPAGVER